MGKRVVKNYPSPRLMETIGATNQSPQEAIGELVANCFDARNKEEKLEISIDLRDNRIIVLDNGKGMTSEVLEKAVCIAEDMSLHIERGDGAKGHFGMGFKTSCSTLGYYYEIYTRPVGDNIEYHTAFDIKEYSTRPSGSNAWDVIIDDGKPSISSPLKNAPHGTAFVISKLKIKDFPVSAVLEYIGNAFKGHIEQGDIIKVIDETDCYQARPKTYSFLKGTKVKIDETFGPKGKYHITGVCIVDKNMTGETIDGIKVLASGDEISVYLCKSWVDEVFVCFNDEHNKIEKKLVEDCLLMGITVHQNLAKIVSEPGKVQIVERMNEYTVLTSAINTASIVESFIKRLMDIVGSIIGLMFTGILFVFVAPAIYKKSPGPIFFKQMRVGKNGKKFYIYKFRSMYLDAEERKAELMAQNKVKDGMMFKMENDPRIIGGENGKGIGNFIRKTSIDEFPQFLNVLKGDMSLVGTRPPTLDEWEKYELHHRARLAIKPGLTGMWQVSGRSDITDFEEVVKLDTEYIMNWNIGKDIQILLKTVLAVFKREGSM